MKKTAYVCFIYDTCVPYFVGYIDNLQEVTLPASPENNRNEGNERITFTHNVHIYNNTHI